MRHLLNILNVHATPQSQPLPGSAQVPNSAGGYAWAVDIWTQLDRFLILGTESGTYYVTEPQLTAENAKAVQECLKADGLRVVQRVVGPATTREWPRRVARS